MKHKFLSTALAIIIFFGASAQRYSDPTLPAKAEKRVRVDSTLLVPTGCGAPWALSALDIAQKHSAEYFDSCNHRKYIWDPKLAAWDTIHIGVSGGSGANTALSNLASVAINTSLLPGTDNSIDLGSSSKQWRSIYLPNTDNSSALGVIFKGGNRFLHTFKLTGTDGENTFMGSLSGNFTMTGSTGIQGSYNTGYGVATLYSNTTGFRSAAFGTYALQNNTTGFSNNAFGQSSLFYNTTGYNNSAVGTRALNFNVNGHSNNAHGTDALFANTSGTFNSAFSIDALYQNTTGSYNSAFGDSTFWIATVGFKNSAFGSRAGYYLGDLDSNYASVKDSMVTFLGADASRDNSISYNTALKNLTVIGYNAKGFASNQVVLGNSAVTTTVLRGNIGIGTITPSVALDITGTVKLNSLTASLPLKLDASKNIISQAIALGGSEVSGTLAVANGGTNNASLPVTAGTVYFADGTKITGDNSNFFWDNTNKRLGIGTASPSQKLHSQGSGTTALFKSTGYSASTVIIEDPDGTTYITNGQFRVNSVPFVLNANASYIGLQTAGVERARVLNTGEVGIGTSTPNSTLHVAGSLSLGYRMVESDSYEIAITDYTLSVNNGASDWSIILPDASTCTGRIYIIKRYDNNSTGLVIVDANSCDVQSPATGSFNTTFDLTAWGTQNQSVMFQSNGTNWEAIK